MEIVPMNSESPEFISMGNVNKMFTLVDLVVDLIFPAFADIFQCDLLMKSTRFQIFLDVFRRNMIIRIVCTNP